jgi:ribosomal protein S14
LKLNYFTKKNSKNYQFFFSKSLSYLFLKFFLKSFIIPIQFRQLTAKHYNKFKYFHFNKRIKFRCMFTNNSKIYHKKYGLSRKELRRNFMLGKIEGFVKSGF